MLAMDVSGSMRAEDVKPNRLVASQEAAKAFVNKLPREVRVGVVSFAGTAAVVQAPTQSREDVLAAIDRFQLQRGTATGSGIILSLATLFPEHDIEIQHVTGQRRFPGSEPLGSKKQDSAFTPVPPGSYNSAAIIMLTDGQRTTGPDPLDAAKMAADRGIRVHVIAPALVRSEIWLRAGMSETDYEALLATRGREFPLGRVGEPEDVAELIRYLVSDKAAWMTGTLIPVDGGAMLR